MVKDKKDFIPEETIGSLIIESSKKIKKETMKFLNYYIVYHKFGIDAIKQNIEVNNNLKQIKDNYKRILSSDNTQKIRNFN